MWGRLSEEDNLKYKGQRCLVERGTKGIVRNYKRVRYKIEK